MPAQLPLLRPLHGASGQNTTCSRRTPGACSCTSSSSSNPLSETTLLTAGPHLIRWATLVFYQPFLRPDPDHKPTVDSIINKEFVEIRSHLHRVDAGRTWKEYVAAYNSESSSPMNSQMEFEKVEPKGNSVPKVKRWRALMRKLRLGKKKVSCIYTEATPSEVELEKLRGARLVEVFEGAAKKLHVSQAMLEMVFEQYARFMDDLLQCPEERCRQPYGRQSTHMNAVQMAKKDDYPSLGRRILVDIDSLAPSNSTRHCSGTELRRYLSSASNPDASDISSVESIRTHLLGANLDLVLRAIWKCRVHYFESFYYNGPKVQCHCRPLKLEQCNWCMAMTRSEGDNGLRITGGFGSRAHDKGKTSSRAAPSGKVTMIKYVLSPRALTDPFSKRCGGFELVHEKSAEELQPLLDSA